MLPQYSAIEYQFRLLANLRAFFLKQGFWDVLTPPMVENPGYEAHIHPFGVYQVRDGEKTNSYLQTSPEFWMKSFLSMGCEKIFTLSYCFRHDIDSPHHRNQFLMLEWYRTASHYTKIMDDCEALITFCSEELRRQGVPVKEIFHTPKFERYTVQELFQEYLGIDILQFLNTKDIKELIEKNYPEVPLPTTPLEWDDYYFLLFLNKIETQLVHRPYLLIYEFPHHLAALSTLKEDDPRVCERFEVYLNGIELCNCFNELRDLKIQMQRFDKENQLKRQLYGYQLPRPDALFKALERGFPPTAGVALGVERLLLALTGLKNPFCELPS